MGVNKTISLDEQTAIIADRMDNFSGWVRLQLRNHARNAVSKEANHMLTHRAPESERIWGASGDKCNPKHKKGLCMACWGEE